MPILHPGLYPSDVVKKQAEILGVDGYHVIFDITSRKNGYERHLPCPTVMDGLSVMVFMYQRQLAAYPTSGRFRICVNYFGRDHYIEIGDFGDINSEHFITTRMDNKYEANKFPNLQVKIGDYFWVEFLFTGTNHCKTYFKDTQLNYSVVYFYKLKYLYIHARHYSGADVVSYHITKSSGDSLLNGKLNTKPLGFTFVTSKILVYGEQNAIAGGNTTIQYSVHADQSQQSVQFSITPAKPVSIIEFRILLCGILATAGDTRTFQQTPFKGDNEVMVQIEDNFYVKKVITRTGMYNW